MERLVLLRRGMTLRPWLLIAAASFAGGGRAMTCGTKASASQVSDQPAEYPVAEARVGAAYERQHVGQVHAKRYVELRSRAKGVVESIAVDEGQAVKAGQVLVTLSKRALSQEVDKARAAVASAAADLRAAEVEVASTRMLFDKQVVAKAELDLAQARLASLGARVSEAVAAQRQAELHLTFAEVKAPFDGVVNRLPRKVGSLVAEDELLTTLTDASEVWVYFRVSEREYLEHTKKGAGPREAWLVLADGTRYPRAGLVDAVESEFDRATGTIAFRATFPNPDGVLRHGASGKVVVREEAPQAVMIPQRATFEVQDNVYVYKVDASSVVRPSRVRVRARVDDAFVLESGLSPGDRFVLEGAQRLREGDRIVAIDAPTQPPKPPAAL